MTLDDKGREGVFAFLQAHGYTGTLADWWDEVCIQSYSSSIRLFDSCWLNSSALRRFPGAQAFVRRVLAISGPQFNVAHISQNHARPSIELHRAGVRRQPGVLRPLRLDGLRLEIDLHDAFGTDADARVVIRCLAYVNVDFRRDRHFTFRTAEGSPGPA